MGHGPTRTRVVVQGVSFRYGALPTLSDVSFAIERGEMVGLIGPNGSGKSTLLRTITRVLEPESGEVQIAGKNLRRYRPSDLARRIAVVAQDDVLNFEFTVRDVVLMGRHPYLRRFEREGPKDLALVNQALQVTRTDHLADRLVTEVSGGERQRVAIARALVQEPEILLLDEPTSHLDINHQVEIFDLLKRQNVDHGLTVLAVLHDLNLAALYCKKLIMLSDGRIAAMGAPWEVISQELIQQVYGADVVISRHPRSNTPLVHLISKV